MNQKEMCIGKTGNKKDSLEKMKIIFISKTAEKMEEVGFLSIDANYFPINL